MIYANRNITEVINYSISDSVAIVNIPVSYNEDIGRVEKLLNELCQRVKEENKKIKGDISCIGITSFDASSINFRITAVVEPTTNIEIERFLLKEIKELFNKENVEIPYNQVVIHNARV